MNNRFNTIVDWCQFSLSRLNAKLAVAAGSFLLLCISANASFAINQWESIDGGGDSICSDGSPYRFMVRKADPKKLVFYLQGGGDCWSYGTCNRSSGLYYMNIPDGNTPYQTGIFNVDNPDNPFVDHTIVFAPYCTADVHIGNTTRTYQGPVDKEGSSPKVVIHHRGKVNVDRVLDWTAKNVNPSERLFGRFRSYPGLCSGTGTTISQCKNCSVG